MKTIDELLGVKTDPSIRAILTLEMEKEIANQKSRAERIETETDRLKKVMSEMDRLKELGMTGSKNYELLWEELKSLEKDETNRKIAKDFLEYMRDTKSVFPESSFLVSLDVFWAILDKYHLTVGPLKEYVGIIPEQNMKELEETKTNIIKHYTDQPDPISLRLWQTGQDKKGEAGAWYFVRGASYNAKVDKYGLISGNIREWLDRNHWFIPMAEKRKSCQEGKKYDGAQWKDVSLHIGDNHFLENLFEQSLSDLRAEMFNDYQVTFEGYIPGEREFLIAAIPKELRGKAEICLSPIPRDPIVFQFCPYGVWVHSMWGTESEDKVWADYRRLAGLDINDKKSE